MTDKLLPCPFCGCEPYYSQPVTGSKWWEVSCNTEDCGAMGPSLPDKAKAAAAWNRRDFSSMTIAAAMISSACNPSPETNLRGELVEYFERQIDWSRETFGPSLRTKGVIDHIRKELKEIEQNPHDLSEWVDVVILAMDGFWRHGGNASDLLPALLAKQRKNMARTWPDWRTMSEDTAIEHDRSQDAIHPSPSPSSPAPQTQMTGALATIVAERQRQIAKGYDAAHDDAHAGGEIIWSEWGVIARINDAIHAGRSGSTEHYVRLLTQAAAQIAAEIERVERAANSQSPDPKP